MKRFSRKQLSEIRKQIKENKSSTKEENKNTKLSSSIRRDLREYNRAKKVEVRWNIKPGDLVYVPSNDNKKTIGIVVKENASGTFKKNRYMTNPNKLKNYNFGNVLVMSSIGFGWFNPSALKKIT